jgi:hypothetical protein
MTDPASALGHIYACSGAETAATYLAQAPGWVRALRDVRERDALNPHRGGGIGSAEASARWDAEHGISDRVILPAGRAAELTAETHIQITVGGVRWEFGTWQVRAYRPDSHAPDPEILQLVTGDDWLELLYERGAWTLGDGTVVHLGREEGLWAEPRPAPPLAHEFVLESERRLAALLEEPGAGHYEETS